MYNELVNRLRSESALPYSAIKDMRAAADAIEKLQDTAQAQDKALKWCADQLARRWIPVTERLPERGYYVLAYEDGDILMASYADGNWVLRDMYEIIELKPTHWMPLPSAPVEETE